MTQRDLKDFKGDVDAVAAFWVVRLNADDCAPEDRYAFDLWRREDPVHEAAYLKIRRGNEYLDRFMDTPEFQARIERARQRTKPPFWRQAPARWAAAAACLVLVAGTVVLNGPFFSPDTTEIVMAQPSEAYETTVGERSTVTLADGSIVTINTNSRIEVDYTSTLREIKLTRGQGFFDVAKDINRPFVVVAGDKRVMALGTIFDVRFDNTNEVQVTLVEGRVKVEELAPVTEGASTSAPSVRTVLAERSIEMSPGERLVAKVDEAPTVIKTDTLEETSWRKGQLVFRNRPLSEVVAEMNRYSSQQLVLDVDDRVLALEVSGVFNNGGRPAAFVDALEIMHPLQAERSGENQLTLVWRE